MQSLREGLAAKSKALLPIYRRPSAFAVKPDDIAGESDNVIVGGSSFAPLSTREPKHDFSVMVLDGAGGKPNKRAVQYAVLVASGRKTKGFQETVGGERARIAEGMLAREVNERFPHG